MVADVKIETEIYIYPGNKQYLNVPKYHNTEYLCNGSFQGESRTDPPGLLGVLLADVTIPLRRESWVDQLVRDKPWRLEDWTTGKGD
ncbi:predicted protein [Histoplasma mississippiense (nom. inval.)]|uniref:predicted protein n=1 Tax=Ajellomyces capsulatus (strain NAm1 / WU24) TaxID=2059318 RepID=UPI000157C605|nr:predicted protein [Histoplasma mississippiense (nom. inval.)]EDN08789.1 predicted protein [Histoplasma mississippiense (nom. inval.)]